MEKLITQLLEAVGEDPSREGLLDTPKRAAEAWKFLTAGYDMDPDEVVNEALFEMNCNDMIIVRDIEIYSLCEHHMLPFFGRVHIGYIPEGRVLGVSKLARIADMYARRMQIQERLTNQIANAIMEAVHPEGVGVVVEARHLCMMMRGVQKQNSLMVSSAMLGSFRSCSSTRNEFLQLIRRPAQD